MWKRKLLILLCAHCLTPSLVISSTQIRQLGAFCAPCFISRRGDAQPPSLISLRGGAPKVQPDKWTEDEDEEMKALHAELGNSWSQISRRISTKRSSNSCRSRFQLLTGTPKKKKEALDSTPKKKNDTGENTPKKQGALAENMPKTNNDPGENTPKQNNDLGENMPKKTNPGDKWTVQEDAELKALHDQFGNSWSKISQIISTKRKAKSCFDRFQRLTADDSDTDQIRQDRLETRQMWNGREDMELLALYERHGNRWEEISEGLNNVRSPRACQKRYSCLSTSPGLGLQPPNQVDPLKIVWTEAEDELLMSEVEKIGKQWAKISQTMEGRRSTVACKGRYAALMKKAKLREGSNAALPSNMNAVVAMLETEKARAAEHFPRPEDDSQSLHASAAPRPPSTTRKRGASLPPLEEDNGVRTAKKPKMEGEDRYAAEAEESSAKKEDEKVNQRGAAGSRIGDGDMEESGIGDGDVQESEEWLDGEQVQDSAERENELDKEGTLGGGLLDNVGAEVGAGAGVEGQKGKAGAMKVDDVHLGNDFPPDARFVWTPADGWQLRGASQMMLLRRDWMIHKRGGHRTAFHVKSLLERNLPPIATFDQENEPIVFGKDEKPPSLYPVYEPTLVFDQAYGLVPRAALVSCAKTDREHREREAARQGGGAEEGEVGTLEDGRELQSQDEGEPAGTLDPRAREDTRESWETARSAGRERAGHGESNEEDEGDQGDKRERTRRGRGGEEGEDEEGEDEDEDEDEVDETRGWGRWGDSSSEEDVVLDTAEVMKTPRLFEDEIGRLWVEVRNESRHFYGEPPSYRLVDSHSQEIWVLHKEAEKLKASQDPARSLAAMSKCSEERWLAMTKVEKRKALMRSAKEYLRDGAGCSPPTPAQFPIYPGVENRNSTAEQDSDQCPPEPLSQTLQREEIRARMPKNCTHFVALLRAAAKGDLELIKDLRSLTGFRDQRGWTPLHYAVLFGKVKAVEAIIKCGCSPGPDSICGANPRDLAELLNIESEKEQTKYGQMVTHFDQLVPLAPFRPDVSISDKPVALKPGSSQTDVKPPYILASDRPRIAASHCTVLPRTCVTYFGKDALKKSVFDPLKGEDGLGSYKWTGKTNT